MIRPLGEILQESCGLEAEALEGALAVQRDRVASESIWNPTVRFCEHCTSSMRMPRVAA